MEKAHEEFVQDIQALIEPVITEIATAISKLMVDIATKTLEQTDTDKMKRRFKRAARQKRDGKYPGIGRAADLMGVSRWHLFEILEGRRRDPKGWGRRYHAMIKASVDAEKRSVAETAQA